MPKFKTKVTIEDKALQKAMKAARKTLKMAIEDCMDDLVQVSGDAAPHYKGILEGSSSKEITVKKKGIEIEATVEYSVAEGDYNYAIKMHETTYKLGEGSLKKPGGQSRMSGKHYEVGPKFLTRPLEGDKEAYEAYINEKLRRHFKT